MLTETSLRKIQNFSAVDPVISLYLNTEPTMGNAETHRLRLRNLLKDIPLEKDVESIEKFFKHTYDWTGRAVAVFSCASSNFFEYIPLAIPVKDFIKVSLRAEIEPLVVLMEDFNHLGVVLVDKQGARLFHFHMGELVEQQGILGDTVKQIKSGGASSDHGVRGGSLSGDRNMQETIDRNLREIREFATKFCETNHIKKIMVGGSDDNIARLKSILPKSMQSMVVGTFPMSMTASHSEVLNKVMQLT